MMWLPDGEKKRSMICLAVSILYRRVMDGQTDIHVAYTHRAVKTYRHKI